MMAIWAGKTAVRQMQDNCLTAYDKCTTNVRQKYLGKTSVRQM